MKCRRFQDSMLESEDGSLGAEAMAHLRACPSCAKVHALMGSAVALYRLPEARCSRDLAPRVAALLPFLPAPRRLVSMRDWVAVGLFLVSGMALLPLASSFGALRNQYGIGITLPLAIVLGLAITSYAVMFIASHLEDFSRRLNAASVKHA